MNNKYIAPKRDLEAFNCPYCGAYAKMNWYLVDIVDRYETIRTHNLRSALCSCCHKFSLWTNEIMLIPSSSTIEMPNEDMPQSVQELYNEARDIVNKSPRGAVALLRLALDKLCDEIRPDCKTKSINDKIGALVANGLSKRLQQSFDFVRVTGNDAVHDLGSINVQDNPEIATTLFRLLNLIVEEIITENKQIDKLYNLIPENLRDSIEDRNNKAKGNKNA